MHPQFDVNVGGAMRACACYEAQLVLYQGGKVTRPQTDTHKAWRHIPLIRVEDLMEAVPYDCVPVAVDLLEGAQSLEAYEHPQRALYVFGPENGTLGRGVWERCRDIVQVPTALCMNLAATANVVLYDRLAKQLR